jgi:pimeloyl-ACP methyl ester carboxylesterase
MHSPKPPYDDPTIHDLFASTPHDLDAHDVSTDSDSDIGARFQGDVYEQLDQLETIDVKAFSDFMAEDSIDSTRCDTITLVDFFEGLAQLATTGVVEVTDIVEAVHREILLRPLGRFNTRNVIKWRRGITSRIYGTVRHITLLVGNNLSSGLQLYNSISNQKNAEPLPKNLQRLVNILNGVMGDHLVNLQNPLAVPMVLYDNALRNDSLYHRNGYLKDDALSGRVIILCHGLCMSHLSWQVSKDNNLGDHIAHSQPNSTVLYLNYNTGRRISSNGHNFSKVLKELVDKNPNITQIDLIGHSMGGLVARSALFYGKQQGFSWVERVSNLVTLGSPHHGASLERIGYYVQDRVAKLPFAGSLATLGDLRSAGIIDLRHGSIRDADWQSLDDRTGVPEDFRHPARLPLHVNTYLIAATLVNDHHQSKVTSLLGDGLVTIESALGEHAGEHALSVPEWHRAVFYGVSHYNLLYNDRVREQVITWLLDNQQNDYDQNNYEFGCRIHSYPNYLEVAV